MTYVSKMKKFKESPLFNNCYDKFVRFLKMSGQTFKSKDLEVVLGIRGTELRQLAQHARRSGVLICSGSYGYKYAKSKNDAESTVKHLKERMKSLQSTIRVMTLSDHYQTLTKGR